MNNQNDSTSEKHLQELVQDTTQMPEALKQAVEQAANPTTKDGKDPEIPSPEKAPKISVNLPNPPQMPQQRKDQKPIHVDLQTEAMGKRICKTRGHKITAIYLRQSIRQELPKPPKDKEPLLVARVTEPPKPMPLEVSENTLVICEQCGASLVQIRG